MGYRITIAYQSTDPYDMGWGSPSEAAIYNVADLNAPLGRLTYNANGTITDLGGRVYACTGCSNALGTDLEIADGTMQLPGDAGPSLRSRTWRRASRWSARSCATASATLTPTATMAARRSTRRRPTPICTRS